MNDLAAILLAGGRATRLDGASKPAQEIGGRTLFDIAVAAAGSAGGEPIIAVGPPMPTTSESPSPVAWTREDPPFGGPVAGIIAALEAWQARAYPDRAWTLLLACDLPRAEAATRILLDAVPLLSADIDGVCLGDASSRPQWLIGCYRTAVLRKAAARMPGGGRDAPVRALLADLAITVLRDPGDSSGDLSHGVSADIDTWEDLLTARRAGKDGKMSDTPVSRTLPPEALDRWAELMREEFALSPAQVPVALVLDLARDVAGGVARPGAPLGAFVAGLVAGRAGATADDIAAAVATVTALAARFDETAGA